MRRSDLRAAAGGKGRGTEGARRERPDRLGYTLLEISVALAVIVVIASLTAPALLRSLGEQTIREQAHRVRVEAASARNNAIDYGVTYQFRYEPGGRKFIVLPYDRPDVASGVNPEVSAVPGAASSSAGPPVQSGELPERCRFKFPQETNAANGAQQPAVTERLPQEWLALVPGGAALQETAWSRPIRFFPDGTADDGSLTIIDDDRRSMDVWVRGFTGTVGAGQLRQEAGL